MSTSISPPTADLQNQLRSSDPRQILDAATQLAIRGEPPGLQAVMDVLLTTNDPVVRNGLAMIVSDQKHPAGFDALVKLLRDERTRAHRGSLLYALGAYDCSPILPMLIDFVIG